ncbi:unnamed protein product [Microthlaspi erraticum]|uniref:Uncharacterized protein n=1 Tax=Microthlaspi erraticum TaxID=1685480 RepID=A0A6D2JDA0_9BRAS|nr:unnamed protein product [Microthlaspi erraticum]
MPNAAFKESLSPPTAADVAVPQNPCSIDRWENINLIRIRLLALAQISFLLNLNRFAHFTYFPIIHLPRRRSKRKRTKKSKSFSFPVLWLIVESSFSLRLQCSYCSSAAQYSISSFLCLLRNCSPVFQETASVLHLLSEKNFTPPSILPAKLGEDRERGAGLTNRRLGEWYWSCIITREPHPEVLALTLNPCGNGTKALNGTSLN